MEVFECPTNQLTAEVYVCSPGWRVFPSTVTVTGALGTSSKISGTTPWTIIEKYIFIS